MGQPPHLTTASAAYDRKSLLIMIIVHHYRFVHLYGSSSYTPSMHCLLDYPKQFLNLGPMVSTWTMRYEAKLHFFKQSSHSQNLKILLFRLTNAHQHWMCYEMATGQ